MRAWANMTDFKAMETVMSLREMNGNANFSDDEGCRGAEALELM